jgi:PTH1 family peptidyl-tRNA hydrolase
LVLVAGLGNPGPEYARTRHNVGFMVADRFRDKLRGTGGVFRGKFGGEVAKGSFGDAEVVVLKPMTFMNRSGASVQSAAAFFQIAVTDVIVIHDDLDLPWQTVRVKAGGGSGGHNGLKSVTEVLGSPDYLRVRVGIGRPPQGDAVEYVLSDFSEIEARELPDVVDRAVLAVEAIFERGIERAMNHVNTKPKPQQ